MNARKSFENIHFKALLIVTKTIWSYLTPLQAYQALADACGACTDADSGDWACLHSHAPGNDLQWMAVPQCDPWSRVWILHLPHCPAIKRHH